MVILNEKQLIEFLDERNYSHLYYGYDLDSMITVLKENEIITGVIYEPVFYNDTFRGINKATNYRMLYVINKEW